MEPVNKIKTFVEELEASTHDPSIDSITRSVSYPEALISIKTKKHKSLGVLTLIFMQLFIKKKNILTLEEATDHILDECEKD